MISPKSFTVNHLNLPAGLYLSQETDRYYVVDLRMINTRGYALYHQKAFEPISPEALHIFEHSLAYHLRQTEKQVFDYVGPMGCQTGFYLIVSKNRSLFNFKPLTLLESGLFVTSSMAQALKQLEHYFTHPEVLFNNTCRVLDVPGMTLETCGNPIKISDMVEGTPLYKEVKKLYNDFAKVLNEQEYQIKSYPK